MRHRLAWLIAGIAVAAVLVQGAVVAVLWHVARPRLPSVSTVSATADTAIGLVIQAAGTSAAVAVGPLLASATCRGPILAHGHLFTRTADLYVDPGTEDGLLGRIAAGLPASDHPTRTAPIGSGPQPLTASLGQGVALQVHQVASGWVAATAKTDCQGDATSAAPSPVTAAEPAPIAAIYATLDTSASAWHTETLTCPHGQIATVNATSQKTDTSNLPARLATAVPVGARRVATQANRVIWRDGAISMIVGPDDDIPQIDIQRTTSC